jgi:transcriptional regulator with XRE-family HTH domain
MALPKAVTPIRFSALRQRREELSRLEGHRLTQEDIADRTGDAVSQRTVSHLEAGSIELGSIAAARLAALARALRWTLGELQEATGIDLAVERASQPAVDVTIITTEPSVEIPAGLLEAAEQFGTKFPALTKRRVQEQLASARFFDGVGPRTAAEWRDYYTSVARWVSDKD